MLLPLLLQRERERDKERKLIIITKKGRFKKRRPKEKVFGLIVVFLVRAGFPKFIVTSHFDTPIRSDSICSLLSHFLHYL